MWDYMCQCVTIHAYADGTDTGHAFRLPEASGHHLAVALQWQHQCNQTKLGHACKRDISAHQISKAFLCMTQALVGSFQLFSKFGIQIGVHHMYLWQVVLVIAHLPAAGCIMQILHLSCDQQPCSPIYVACRDGQPGTILGFLSSPPREA